MLSCTVVVDKYTLPEFFLAKEEFEFPED